MIILLIIVGCICAFIILNTLYKKTNDYNNENIFIKDFLKQIPDDIKIVNTGSTYAKFAFGSYGDMGLNAFNFALRNQGLRYDYTILKQYCNKIDKGAIVLITLSPEILLFDNSDNDLLYYKILQKKYINNYSFFRKLKSNLPIITNPKKIKKIIKDVNQIDCVYDIYPEYMTEDCQEEEMKHLITIWTDMFKLKDFKNPEISSELMKVMETNQKNIIGIIELCREHGWKPVIILPPFGEKLNKYFTRESLYKTIGKTLEEIREKEDVTVINYQYMEYFQNKPYLYVDGAFLLNRTGSFRFINILFNDLKEKNIYV